MQKEPEAMFIQWLGAVLRDEQWRAIIRAQVQEHELPIIEAGAGVESTVSRRRRVAG